MEIAKKPRDAPNRNQPAFCHLSFPGSETELGEGMGKELDWVW